MIHSQRTSQSYPFLGYGNKANEAGEGVLADDRKDPQDMGDSSRKESTSDTLDNAADSVVDSIVECKGATKILMKSCHGGKVEVFPEGGLEFEPNCA